MTIYLLKINSVHLNIAKPIFVNSWVLESYEFMVLNIIFEKAPLGLFPYRAYISHRNDRPDPTQKV